MSIYRIDREEEAIAEVQRYLRAISYKYDTVPHVGVDGIYGEETKEAVLAFQLLFELLATGVVDAPTFALLYREFLTVPAGTTQKNASFEIFTASPSILKTNIQMRRRCYEF